MSNENGLALKMRKIYKDHHYTVENCHMVKFCQIMALYENLENLS